MKEDGIEKNVENESDNVRKFESWPPKSIEFRKRMSSMKTIRNRRKEFHNKNSITLCGNCAFDRFFFYIQEIPPSVVFFNFLGCYQ